MIPGAPLPDCPLCPRLMNFRHTWRDEKPGWFNAPVPAFGPRDARLLVVGLAPGLRGANATGRPFTGDGAGDFLYPALIQAGYARGNYGAGADDGLALVDCRITNAVRCVPPENKPLAAEIRNCNPFLARDLTTMPRLDTVLALGGVAHQAVLDACRAKRSAFPFAHGAIHELAGGLVLVDSYHCSRLNTNTGRLTWDLFMRIFTIITGRHAAD